MRLKPFGRDLRLDLRKRGGGAATPLKLFNGFIRKALDFKFPPKSLNFRVHFLPQVLIQANILILLHRSFGVNTVKY